MANPFPDVSAAVVVLERMMVDRCTITHEPPRRKGDTFDQATGLYTEGAGQPESLYTGKCKIRVVRAGGTGFSEGGRTELVTQYQVGLPLSAPAIPSGAVVTMTKSVRDRQLTGRSFRVVEPVVGTIVVQRKLIVEEVTGAYAGVHGHNA